MGNIENEGFDIKSHLLDSPVHINLPLSLNTYKEKIFSEHIDEESIPLIYTEPKPFMIVRPTAFLYSDSVKDRLVKCGLEITQQLDIDNFIKLSDVLYVLSEEMDFTWRWRIVTRLIHERGIQNQNRARAFIFRNVFEREPDYDHVVKETKLRIRNELGDTPYILQNLDQTTIVNLHHLHAPNFSRIQTEYNILMHAINKTSVFK